jgi:hypothetical protein
MYVQTYANAGSSTKCTDAERWVQNQIYECGMLGVVPDVRMRNVRNSPRCTEARYQEMYQMYRFKMLRIKMCKCNMLGAMSGVQMKDILEQYKMYRFKMVGSVADVHMQYVRNRSR